MTTYACQHCGSTTFDCELPDGTCRTRAVPSYTLTVIEETNWWAVVTDSRSETAALFASRRDAEACVPLPLPGKTTTWVVEAAIITREGILAVGVNGLSHAQLRLEVLGEKP